MGISCVRYLDDDQFEVFTQMIAVAGNGRLPATGTDPRLFEVGQSGEVRP